MLRWTCSLCTINDYELFLCWYILSGSVVKWLVFNLKVVKVHYLLNRNLLFHFMNIHLITWFLVIFYIQLQYLLHLDTLLCVFGHKWWLVIHAYQCVIDLNWVWMFKMPNSWDLINYMEVMLNAKIWLVVISNSKFYAQSAPAMTWLGNFET